MTAMARKRPASKAMSLSLAFRFLAGRYHATPFGHHVNEGLIEWPPSPWRLLRALISVGYTSGAWNGTGPPAAARGLVEKLSAELPCYRLPPAVGAHSRHYMPVGVLDRKTRREETTLVFDTWVRIGDGELTVTWRDVCLDRAEASILGDLVQCLNYLGRSESWVAGRVMGESEPVPEANCFPEPRGEAPGHGCEPVALLAARSVSDFAAWRVEQLDGALASLPLPDGRKPSKTLLCKREKAAEPYPDDLLDCLQKTTTWWRSHGWSWPPGSRRVPYRRPSDAIAVGAPKAKRATPPEQRVEAMLLALTNASRNDHALPPVTRTLPQAELLHCAIVGIAARHRSPPSELTGCDGNGRPLRGRHEHAHVNPLDLDGDGHLDHILIWAPMGLGAEAQAAIRAARKTFTKGGIEPLRLALAATGDLRDLVRLPGRYGQRIACIAGCAETWQSVTPFVPPRYVKANGRNTLEGQIRAELHSRGFPEPAAVHPLAPAPRRRSDAAPTRGAVAGAGETTWSRFRHFIFSRRRGLEPPIACGFSIRLEFERPVSGPVALGYGSHFGLGLFERYASVRTGAATAG